MKTPHKIVSTITKAQQLDNVNYLIINASRLGLADLANELRDLKAIIIMQPDDIK